MAPSANTAPAGSAQPGVVRRMRVADPYGIHLRLAAEIVKAVRCLKAEVLLEHGEGTADAHSILSIVTLGAGPGTMVVVRAVGTDAEEAVHALLEVLTRNADGGGFPSPELENRPSPHARQPQSRHTLE